MKYLLNTKCRILLLLLIGFSAYSSIVFQNSIVNPDAQYIVPLLRNVSGLLDYLNDLIHFKTLDIQPIRDLSIYLDIIFFDLTGINISIAHNLILWIGCCWVGERILKKSFPDLSQQESFLIICLFLVYPLFSQTVSWGIARKHILSFLFTLLATDVWIRRGGIKTYKDSILINGFYVCAILSQPISILWPVWAALYTFLINRPSLKATLIKLIPSFLILIIVAYLNYLYYATSPIFLNSYSSKTNEVLEISDKVLAFGHYIFQVFFPYLLSFTYTLGHWSTLVGLLIFGIIFYLILGLGLDRRFVMAWTFFGILPLSVVVLKSTMLYDTYLLFPAFSSLLLLVAIKQKLKVPPKLRYIYLPIFLVFIGFTYFESSAWKNDLLMTKKSFERRPSCLSAFQYLKTSYENEVLPDSNDAKTYLLEYECDKFQVEGSSLIILQSYMLYYDSLLPTEERISKLKILSPMGIFPNIVLTSFYIKLNRLQEARDALEMMIQKWGKHRFKEEYLPIVDRTLYPFCVAEMNEECLQFLRPFIIKRNNLSYK